MNETKASRLWRDVLGTVSGLRLHTWKTTERFRSGVPDILGVYPSHSDAHGVVGCMYAAEVKYRELSATGRVDTKLWLPDAATALQQQFMMRLNACGAACHYVLYVDFTHREHSTWNSGFVVVPPTLWAPQAGPVPSVGDLRTWESRTLRVGRRKRSVRLYHWQLHDKSWLRIADKEYHCIG